MLNRDEAYAKISILQRACDQAKLIEFASDRVIAAGPGRVVSTPLDSGVTGVVHYDELYTFLKRTKGPTIEVEDSPAHVTLYSARSKLELKKAGGSSTKASEALAKDAVYATLPSNFIDAVLFCKGSIATSSSGRPHLEGLAVVDNHIQGMSTVFVARATLNAPMSSMLIHKCMLPIIEDLEPIEYAVWNKQVAFRNAAGTTLQCNQLPYKAEDMAGWMLVSGDGVTLPPEFAPLAKAVADYGSCLATFTSCGGKLTVSASNAHGNFSEYIELASEMPDVSFSLDSAVVNRLTLDDAKLYVQPQYVVVKSAKYACMAAKAVRQ